MVHPVFTFVIIVIIVANIVVLAMDRVNISPQELQITDTLNSIFEYAFIAEMIVKLMGMGFKEYARDYYNLLDALLVVASVVDRIF